MTRIEILEKINEVIDTEHGKAVGEDSLLIESGMDSFGYAIFWLSLDETLGKCFSTEEVSSFDYKTLKISQLIDRIEQCISTNTFISTPTQN